MFFASHIFILEFVGGGKIAGRRAEMFRHATQRSG
jgi:hypothetical protein